jgi:S1-C subfamily serine protease
MTEHDLQAVAFPKQTPRGDLAEDEKTTIEIFRHNLPSVVHITTLAIRPNITSLDLMQIPKGTATGFIWDQEGHVVTNYHVIQGGMPPVS